MLVPGDPPDCLLTLVCLSPPSASTSPCLFKLLSAGNTEINILLSIGAGERFRSNRFEGHFNVERMGKDFCPSIVWLARQSPTGSVALPTAAKPEMKLIKEVLRALELTEARSLTSSDVKGISEKFNRGALRVFAT